MQSDRRLLAVFALTLWLAGPVAAQAPPPIQRFLDLGSSDQKAAAAAASVVAAAWSDGYAPMLVDMARLLPGSPVRARLIDFLERQTGQRFGDDLASWRKWMWARPYDPHPDYAAFKGIVYERIDPKMKRFFATAQATIRLDEVDWGGVKVNGIPPLVNAPAVPAAQATWLADDHWVFGVSIGGQARAYPKRILAWHEMALDRVGGVDITLVYCTLCGTAIPYESRVNGARRTFGTSGLLYRSNKLMFDEETGSLWSTLEGRPVVGPLVGSGATLVARPIVTTRWSEWRRAHPDTDVLSLETGFDRDYGEGVAYRDYFSTDRLMFRTPFNDTRLANKDEVLGVLVPAVGGGRQAVAFAASALARRPVVMATVEGRAFVVVTSRAGANRVFEAGDVVFASRRGEDRVVDSTGKEWRVTEDALVPIPPASSARSATPRPRVAAFRAFWFGWHAQFPDTLLVK